MKGSRCPASGQREKLLKPVPNEKVITQDPAAHRVANYPVLTWRLPRGDRRLGGESVSDASFHHLLRASALRRRGRFAKKGSVESIAA